MSSNTVLKMCPKYDWRKAKEESRHGKQHTVQLNLTHMRQGCPTCKERVR